MCVSVCDREKVKERERERGVETHTSGATPCPETATGGFPQSRNYSKQKEPPLIEEITVGDAPEPRNAQAHEGGVVGHL